MDENADGTDEGGPAFPVADTYHPNGQVQYGSAGMTLRDYFAAKALQALVHATQTMTNVTPMMVADEAYVYADALMEVRGR